MRFERGGFNAETLRAQRKRGENRFANHMP